MSTSGDGSEYVSMAFNTLVDYQGEMGDALGIEGACDRSRGCIGASWRRREEGPCQSVLSQLRTW